MIGSAVVAQGPRMVLLSEAFDRTVSARVSSGSSSGSVLSWALGPGWGLASELGPDWGPASELQQEPEGPFLQGGLEPVLLGPGDLLGLVLAWR